MDLLGGARENDTCALHGHRHPPHHHQHQQHHHHHHIFYVSPHCPFHRSVLLPNHHSPSCSFSTHHSASQTQLPISTNPVDACSGLPNSQRNESDRHNMMVQDDFRKPESEEEDEPVFVLTDEWRDFFEQSEAKRRLAKNHSKQKGGSQKWPQQ